MIKKLSLISGLMIFISLSSLYAQFGEYNPYIDYNEDSSLLADVFTSKVPTVEQMQAYEKEVASYGYADDIYLKRYDMYADEAKKMGLKNAYAKDIYFLYRYVNQVSYNPKDFYNYKLSLVWKDKLVIVYLWASGNSVNLKYSNESILNQLDYPYVFTHFCYKKDDKYKELFYVPYIIKNKKIVYLYKPNRFLNEYYYRIDNEVFGPFNN